MLFNFLDMMFHILGDPEEDFGSKGKSKRAEKNGGKKRPFWLSFGPTSFPRVPEDGYFTTLGDNGTTPPSRPRVYWGALSPQSSPLTVWIMADEERLKIVVELRKFRKKLRQIEKLEELERDLTDEEFFKVNYCQ